MVFLRSSVSVGFHFHLHCLFCDGVIYSFERVQPFSPWRKGHSLTSLARLPQRAVRDLYLSSHNCGGPSSGNHFGDRIRISVSWFHFYQPLLCVPVSSCDAAVSVMAGIFIDGFVSEHCQWRKVGYLIPIGQTVHRYIFIVSSSSVTKWSEYWIGTRPRGLYSWVPQDLHLGLDISCTP